MSYLPDESTEQLYAEGAWLQGAIATGVLYGVVIVLFAMCWHSLWPRTRSHATGYKRNRFFLCYVALLFVVGTIYIGFSAQITQMGFVNNRLYPGGPAAYEEATSSAPLNTAFVVSDWCANILMIWRCTVVYRDTKIHRIIIVLGSILFLGTVVCGTLWLVIVSTPAQAASGWMSFSLLFPYLCFSLAINIFISLLTVIRLLYHRHRISKVLGSGHGAIYASFSAIIIESASIYSICSLLYLIPYAFNSPIAYVFIQLLGEAQVIAPLLIVYRVAEGKAWTNRSATIMDSNSVQMRRVSGFPKPEPASALPNHLNDEINFHEEIVRDENISFHEEIARDENISFPKLLYSKASADDSTDKVDALAERYT